MPYSMQLACVVAAPAEAVWAETRDFIEQTKHMGLRDKVTKPDPAVGSTTVGCARVITMKPGMAIKEILTRHSDEMMTFSLTVEPSPIMPMVGYDGTVTLTRLGAAGDQ